MRIAGTIILALFAISVYAGGYGPRDLWTLTSNGVITRISDLETGKFANTGGVINGNTTIGGNLTVSNSLIVSNIFVTNMWVYSYISNGLTVRGDAWFWDNITATGHVRGANIQVMSNDIDTLDLNMASVSGQVDTVETQMLAKAGGNMTGPLTCATTLSVTSTATFVDGVSIGGETRTNWTPRMIIYPGTNIIFRYLAANTSYIDFVCAGTTFLNNIQFVSSNAWIALGGSPTNARVGMDTNGVIAFQYYVGSTWSNALSIAR